MTREIVQACEKQPLVLRGGPSRLAPYVRLSLASKSRVLHVGVTADLLHRMWEHRTGAFPGFTRRYGVHQLVYYEETDNPTAAIRREKQIKDWARVKKVAMIDSTNPGWNDLAEPWFADVSSADPSHALGVTGLPPALDTPSVMP